MPTGSRLIHAEPEYSRPSTDYRAILGFYSFDPGDADSLSQFEAYVSVIENKLALDFQREKGSQFVLAGLGQLDQTPSALGSSIARVSVHRPSINPRGVERASHTVFEAQSSAVSILKADTVTLSRGRSGAQNIYYLRTERGVLFSSHISFFSSLKLPTDFNSIAFFLRFLYIPAPNTIYSSVCSVLPGQIVSINSKGISTEQLDDNGSMERVAFGDAAQASVDGFHHVLTEQVSHAIRDSGRPIILLSGGKDSSALAIAAASSEGKSVETVTVGFRDSPHDESGDATLVASSLGLQHHTFWCSTEDMLTHLDEFVVSCGQPMGDPAAFPLFLLLRKLAGSYDLVIDGTGNDSYFGLICGKKGRMLWRAKRQLFRGCKAEGLVLSLVENSTRLAGLRRALEPVEEQFVSMGGFSAAWIKSKTGLVPDWRGTELYRVLDRSATADEHFTKTVCGIWEPEAAYRKTVQSSALNGLGIAFPFLGRRVREFVEDLDDVWRTRRGVNKWLIREYLKAHLPTEIVEKPKGSFVVPKQGLFDPGRNPYIKNMLGEGVVIDGAPIVSPDEVKRLFRRRQEGGSCMDGKLYALLVLSVWSVVSRREKNKVQLWF